MTESREKRAFNKISRIPVKIVNTTKPIPKPDWIRIKLKSSKTISDLKSDFRNIKSTYGM